MNVRRILLVEPGYKNKYPPLGLMKISAYHKMRGDHVEFVKGRIAEMRKQKWDRIYIATLFTFFWKETIRTIGYYTSSTDSLSSIYVGGVMATLMGDEIRKEYGVTVMSGLLDSPFVLDSDSPHIVDHQIPDYSILRHTEYRYAIGDAYLGYATRGCPNRCQFCAVNRIEPTFVHYLPLKAQIKGIEAVYGPKRDLLLLDNNVLASNKFDSIVQDILDLGFAKGEKFNGKLRRLDFNQGMDARKLTRARMRLLAKTSISPLRLALDNIALKDRYVKCIKMARDHGLLKHSTYVLYNYMDTPQDFYARMRLNVMLNENLGTKISSFPMKFIPLDAKDRTFVGKHWTRRLIRGVQCILLATHGMVSPRREFFEAAFGRSADEFVRIAIMPERYIIYRRKHENNGAHEWNTTFDRLGKNQMLLFLETISKGRVTEADIARHTSVRLKRILEHYLD